VLFEGEQRGLQLVGGELVAEPREHARRQLVERAELDQLGAEQRLGEVARRRALAADQVRPDRIERQRAVRIEQPGTKLDRGQMAFAHRAQAEHDAQAAARHAALLGRRHDRRVEQRRGLDRVLVGEVGPDQQAALVADPDVARHVMRDQVELPLEDRSKAVMAAFEPAQGVGVERVDLSIGNREDARHQHVRARRAGEQDLLARDVRFGEHATSVGQEPVTGAFDRNGLHGQFACRVSATGSTPGSRPSPASSNIFSSDVRKQIVLSAPWF
jgi:hypothetical protein